MSKRSERSRDGFGPRRWGEIAPHEAGLRNWLGPQYDGQPQGMMNTPASERRDEQKRAGLAVVISVGLGR